MFNFVEIRELHDLRISIIKQSLRNGLKQSIFNRPNILFEKRETNDLKKVTTYCGNNLKALSLMPDNSVFTPVDI